jgi:hypothetical protein
MASLGLSLCVLPFFVVSGSLCYLTAGVHERLLQQPAIKTIHGRWESGRTRDVCLIYGQPIGI